ncbi:MAG: hypothetical protein IAE90_07500 [Ignavibacteria bacterium]|nr:hypothetical protein [Ignavibacteria bacterium]
MAKQYVNGYDKPRFLVEWRENGVPQSELIEISFKYKALREFYEAIGTVEVFKGGRRIIDIDHVEYEWRLIFNNIENPDTLALGRLENHSILKRRITMWPHREIEARKFVVGVLPEKRVIDTNPHLMGYDWVKNRGLEMTFISLEPISEVDILDPNTYYAGMGGSSEPTGPVKGVVQ